ncbi:MAG: TM0106 family RecB-like putative nuclease [Aquihabitans sp.]
MTDVAPSRHMPRREVSTVSPQGGYAAKRCPLRVQYDLFPPAGVVPLEPNLVDRFRMEAGNTFEAEVFQVLVAQHPEAAIIEGLRGEAAEAATVAAMQAGAPLILGGRLPTDQVGRRVGRPDVLVLAGRSTEGNHAYHPVDVKHHKTVREVTPERKSRGGTLVAPLTDPFAVDAKLDEALINQRSIDDLLQLAHYHRMLEAVGHAAPDALGGIIGKEQVVVWHHLAEVNVKQLWDRRREALESPLQRYDFEFSFRLDVLAAAAEGQSIVEPVAIGECATCPWTEHCGPQILAADSTSLIPGHGYKQWHALRRRGIGSRTEMATLDHQAARLADAYQSWDLVDHVAEAARHPAATPIAELVGRRSTDRLRVLADHGIETAGDLAGLDPRVVALADFPWRSLATSVHQAQVTIAGHHPELAFGVEDLQVPRADVEIDIDMENGLDGTVYLWGALARGHYVAASSWETPSAMVDAEVFAAFWSWLTAARQSAQQQGQTIAIYCWFATAESTALRRGAAAAADLLGLTSAPAEVEELIADDSFVDLFAVFAQQVVTGHGNGLKVVAPMAGFQWRDSDPGGAESMIWHHEAVTGTDRDQQVHNQQRLLAYNEDDVRATAAIREWMSSGAVLPHGSHAHVN